MGIFDDLLPNCVKHAKAMGGIEKRLEEKIGRKKMSDLIERQEAIDAIPEVDADIFENCGRCELLTKEEVVSILNRLPSAQPDQKKGKWINGVCNQCGSHAPYWPMASTYYESNFCPNCGADMRGDDNEPRL